MFQTEVVTLEFSKKKSKQASKQVSQETSTVLEGPQGKNVIQTTGLRYTWIHRDCGSTGLRQEAILLDSIHMCIIK